MKRQSSNYSSSTRHVHIRASGARLILRALVYQASSWRHSECAGCFAVLAACSKLHATHHGCCDGRNGPDSSSCRYDMLLSDTHSSMRITYECFCMWVYLFWCCLKAYCPWTPRCTIARTSMPRHLSIICLNKRLESWRGSTSTSRCLCNAPALRRL